MNYKKPVSLGFLFTVLLAVFVIPQTVKAGPPLICHPFHIGDARSLPWAGGDARSGANWRGVKSDYDLSRLVEDTLALLTPEAPVIVRMETLRRATVYAVWAMRDRAVGLSVKDDKVARALLARLEARAREAEAKGKPDALASFDAGYLAECYKQSGLDTGTNGYGSVLKAIGLRGGDAEMELAAALISMQGRQKETAAHAERAWAGAKTDSLLAINLASHFIGEGETIGAMLTGVKTAKN